MCHRSHRRSLAEMLLILLGFGFLCRRTVPEMDRHEFRSRLEAFRSKVKEALRVLLGEDKEEKSSEASAPAHDPS